MSVEFRISESRIRSLIARVFEKSRLLQGALPHTLARNFIKMRQERAEARPAERAASTKRVRSPRGTYARSPTHYRRRARA